MRIGTRYGAVAPFYEGLAWIYSGGAIQASKRHQLAMLVPGGRALYAGAGAGEDAVLAARRGVEVTLVDRSPHMLRRAERRFEKAGVRASFVAADIFDYRPARPFDAVLANYFLNVFGPEDVPRVLARLTEMLRRGGELMIADFAPASGPWLRRRLFELYYLPPLSFFYLATGNAWHEIYDYEAAATQAGLVETARVDFAWAGVGPSLFRSASYVRQHDVDAAKGG